jgi:putative solute:sodium symporter small subunit
MSQDKSGAREAHWTKTRNLTIIILILWFIFSFGVHWFAKGLNEITFIGRWDTTWPFKAHWQSLSF